MSADPVERLAESLWNGSNDGAYPNWCAVTSDPAWVMAADITRTDARERLKPRERWQFLGRETHYGFDYLIWTLAANPRAPRTLGTRWARVVEG